MDRQKLMDLGQKGFSWAKKKYEEKNQDASSKPAAAPSYTPQPSYKPQPSYPGSTPSHGHGQHGGPPAHVCFQAHPVTNPLVPARQPRKLTVANVDFLGEVHSVSTTVKRDLGFQGQLGPYVLLTYGDTMYTNTTMPSHTLSNDTFMGMTSDSMALATHDPLQVIDPVLDDRGYPPQFCPLHKEYQEDPSECALGVTNVVETTPGSGQGILFFLLNHRPGGVNNLKGAGVATVSLSDTYPPTPTVTRLDRYWWDGDTEPWYGDVCALRHSDHIYAYGHTKHDPFVYLARVHWQSATWKDCYEYWNGSGWQKQVPKTTELGEKAKMFWQINQGQVTYSEYLGCFLFVYCDNWWNAKVLAQTAPAPEGPWSDPMDLYQATPISKGGSVYAAVPHPYYDRSGKTLVVTFTNHPNVIQAIRITFGDNGPV